MALVCENRWLYGMLVMSIVLAVQLIVKLTALVCWLPLGIAYIVYFVKTHIKKWDMIGGAAILAVLSVLLITMPESLLKSEDTPYVYDNAGWYEQFIDENGAIIDHRQE